LKLQKAHKGSVKIIHSSVGGGEIHTVSGIHLFLSLNTMLETR